MNKKRTNLLSILAVVAGFGLLVLGGSLGLLWYASGQPAAIAGATPTISLAATATPVPPFTPTATRVVLDTPTVTVTPDLTAAPTPTALSSSPTVTSTRPAKIIVPGQPTLDSQAGLNAQEACQVRYEREAAIATICADAPHTQYFHSFDGCLTFYFPAGAVTADTIVTHQPRLWPYPNLIPLTSYDLNATTVTGAPLTRFNAEITVDFHYNPAGMRNLMEYTITSFVWNETAQTWDPLATAVDGQADVSQFRTDRPGYFHTTVAGAIESSAYPGACDSLVAQSTPTPSTELLLDIPSIFGRPSLAEVEQRLGGSIKVEPAEQDLAQYGTELRTYQAGDHQLFLVFDEQGAPHFLVLQMDITRERYRAEDWPSLLARFNLHPNRPTGQGVSSLAFTNFNGFDINLELWDGSMPAILRVYVAEAPS